MLYADERVMEAAAVGVPHPKLGEVVAAVVSVKPAWRGKVTEVSLISIAAKKCVSQRGTSFVNSRYHDSLPKFAVPVLVVVRDEELGVYICNLHFRMAHSTDSDLNREEPSRKDFKGRPT